MYWRWRFVNFPQSFLCFHVHNKRSCVNCALKISLPLCFSCAPLICPVCQTPPVTTRRCAGLCTQKPGSCALSWRRSRAPKRWVLVLVIVPAAGSCRSFLRHVNCSLSHCVLLSHYTADVATLVLGYSECMTYLNTLPLLPSNERLRDDQ